jgi:hypothetical protein
MKSIRLLAQVALASTLIILIGWIAITSRLTEASGIRQSEALADLVGRIVRCSGHPCLGDCAKKVRDTLQGRLVNDGYFDYSDLATSYPEVSGTLQGVVEWNLEGTLEDVSLIIVDFQADPAILRVDLERTLPGCAFADTAEDDHEADTEEPDSRTTEWECSVHPEGRDELGITVHLAPELVFLEIES